MEGVRPATNADLPRLLELFADLRDEMAEYRGRWYDDQTWPEPIEEALAAVVDDAEALVLLGTIDAYPVGYAVCEIETMLPQAGAAPIGKVRDLFVEPEAREVGVGELLLNEVVRWLDTRGVRCADISVLPGHRAAKNFCEENGFVSRAITMHSRWD